MKIQMPHSGCLPTLAAKKQAPSSTTGVLAPAGEAKIKARLAEIEHTLLAGFVTPKLERALLAEKAKLENLLLTAVQAPSSTTSVLAPAGEAKIKARLEEIEHTLLAGFVTPDLERALLAEKAALESLLLQAAAG